MHVVDALDERLIALLRADGRAPISQVAASLHVSRGTAQNRLDRLIEAGVIPASRFASGRTSTIAGSGP